MLSQALIMSSKRSPLLLSVLVAFGICHSFSLTLSTHLYFFSLLSLSFLSCSTSVALSSQNELSFSQTMTQSITHGDLSLSSVTLPIQVNSAFVWAATQGAETVIDGCVDPINGAMDEPAFLWSGVFLSQGGAAAAHLGGERGKRAAQRLELRAVQVPVTFDPTMTYDT